MTPSAHRRPASFALLAYYALLLLSTALSYHQPYPLLAWVLRGPAARLAVVLDCLVLVHIVVGIAKAQRVTWYLMTAYGAFSLVSLGLVLAGTPMAELAADLGFQGDVATFRAALVVSGATMGVALLYGLRMRGAFWDRNPYLF